MNAKSQQYANELKKYALKRFCAYQIVATYTLFSIVHPIIQKIFYPISINIFFGI